MLTRITWVLEVNSTTVARSYIVITICTPLTWVGVCVHEMVSMSYLLVIFVESSSVTCYRAVGNSVGGRKVLYRTRIHVDAAQISYKCCFGGIGHRGKYCYLPVCMLYFLVSWGEIVVNPSDVKHVMELLCSSNGLGNIIMAYTHRGYLL